MLMIIRGAMSPLLDNQIDAILEVLTPWQLSTLACMLKKVKDLGYGRVTLAIQKGEINQIQIVESYDFRSESIDKINPE